MTAFIALLLLANLAVHVVLERRAARLEQLVRDSLVELKSLTDATRTKRLSRW